MPSHVTPQTPGLTPTDHLLLDIRDLLTRIADVVAPATPEPSGIETMNGLLEDAAGEGRSYAHELGGLTVEAVLREKPPVDGEFVETVDTGKRMFFVDCTCGHRLCMNHLTTDQAEDIRGAVLATLTPETPPTALTDDVLVQVEEQLTESFTEALAEGNAEKAAEAATAAVQAGLIREQRKAKRR